MLPCRFGNHAVKKGIGCGAALLWQSSTPREWYACKLNWLRQQVSHHTGRRARPMVAFASAVHANELTLSEGLVLQVIGPTNDGKEFDKEDALLQLDQGRPRCGRQLSGVHEPLQGTVAKSCCAPGFT